MCENFPWLSHVCEHRLNDEMFAKLDGHKTILVFLGMTSIKHLGVHHLIEIPS